MVKNIADAASGVAWWNAMTDLQRAEALRVAAGLRQISLNGIDALLVVSRPDPGIDFVDRHAPGPIRESEGLPRFVRVNISGTDHTFTTLSSQRRVLEITTQYLVRHR